MCNSNPIRKYGRMLIAALVHHVILFFVALGLFLNYWSDGTGGSGGKMGFFKDLDGSDISIGEKLIALVIGLVHVVTMIWLVALVLFYLYLRLNKVTAYQYKEKKRVKIN